MDRGSMPQPPPLKLRTSMRSLFPADSDWTSILQRGGLLEDDVTNVQVKVEALERQRVREKDELASATQALTRPTTRAS